MTGSCFNKEAHDIIFKMPCIVRSTNLNLKNYLERDQKYRGQYFLTPIEHYITPTKDEELDYSELDYSEEEQDYPETYYERVETVINIIKEKLNGIT